MGKRHAMYDPRPCPLCKGSTLYRGQECNHCHGKGSLRPILDRPTCRPMLGGETGKAAIGKTLAFVDTLDPATWCTADDARGPA